MSPALDDPMGWQVCQICTYLVYLPHGHDCPGPRDTQKQKCGRWDEGHLPHEWSTPLSRRDNVRYWCNGPTMVEGGRRGPAA